MRNLKRINAISLLTFSATALTCANINHSYAQTFEAQTTQSLNLRNGANANDIIILTIRKGSNVDVVESLGEWSRVKYKNYIGYVSSKYLIKSTTGDINKYHPDKIILMECNSNLLNVRSGPSTSEHILGKLKKGDQVEVLYEINRNWARIKYNGGHGYVSLQYLSKINSNPIPPNSTPMYCNTSTLNIRKGPSSNDFVIGYLKKDDKINVIENLNNGWSRVNYNNTNAYVNSQYLSTSSSNTLDNNAKFMKCNIDILNIRMGPSKSERIIGQLKNNDTVEVIYHVSTGWTKIKFYNKYAYVNTSYLSSI